MNNEEDGTECTVTQGGITVTASTPLGITVSELLTVFKQVSVGLGFADYGDLMFEEEENVKSCD